MRGFGDGQIDGAPVRRRPRRLSQLFAQMARDADGQVSLASIRDALGDRSFAALLVLFAAFNLLPLPPGATAISGLPLVIVSAQMMYGSKRTWLPRFLMDRSISAETFRRIMDWTVPRLIRLERLIQPRYWPFWRRQGDRVIGVMTSHPRHRGDATNPVGELAARRLDRTARPFVGRARRHPFCCGHGARRGGYGGHRRGIRIGDRPGRLPLVAFFLI